MTEGQDDPTEESRSAETRPEDPPTELQDGSLAEPPPPAPEPADGFDPVDQPPAERSAEYVAFEQRARLAEDRLSEVLGAYRKLKTETEEHRVRVTRNIERRFDQRHERLLLKFIDILDNLDRALGAAEQTFAGEALIQGLILVRTQLLQTLKDEGLERIPVLGLPYDPHVSEGVAAEPVADRDQDQVVIKELMRGYRLNGRVARAARVVIGRYESPAAEAASEPASDDPPVPPADASSGDTPAEGLPVVDAEHPTGSRE